MDDLQLRLADLADKQNRYLQDLAVEELGRQKQRIETYQVQARFELAAIYDKTTNAPAKDKAPKDKAPKEKAEGKP
jgi:hypothetical protein